MKPAFTATYRLQLNSTFTFRDAAALVPYLAELGISHLYTSPCLATRPGSPHGYDIIDHNALNPDLGSSEDFEALVATLRKHGMGLLMDIVPNHMGVGSDNAWWMDVLEHGEASLYADWFDIDWQPPAQALRGKLLLPFLGEQYGEALEGGRLRLVFEPETGSFHVAYYEHRFPIDPRSYSLILEWRPAAEGSEAEGEEELRELVKAFRAIGRRSLNSRPLRRRRREAAERCKGDLARLCRESPALRRRLQAVVEEVNGSEGQPASFDRLHRMLEGQAWRLAYWKVAADEINYRRFFDINDLAGLRQEEEEVFSATHRLIAELAARDCIDGVRVDHVDGLSDPSGYCLKLRRLLGGASRDNDGRADEGPERACAVYVEKILAPQERLPDTWPVEGTTGYEFAALAEGLFVYPGNRRTLDGIYRRFAGGNGEPAAAAYADLLYASKKFIILNALSGELTVLANLLSRIAEADRRTRDFTRNSLRNALVEVVACFPVYRTYVTAWRVRERDRRDVQQAIDASVARNAGDPAIFHFIRDILVAPPLRFRGGARQPGRRRLVVGFCLRFQQYTSMVAAKGMEDTAFYRYFRLASLNEVGFSPQRFGIEPDEFHAECRRRLRDWPLSMNASSTHDSKRSEDLRARLHVLSELAEEWGTLAERWKRCNRDHKRMLPRGPAPSANDEYLLYQTLLGVWPPHAPDAGELQGLRERLQNYMLKAVREAKLRSSWADPDAEYEQALRDFVEAVTAPEHKAFFDSFLPFQQRLARYGLLNSLSATLLKLIAPGLPDLYQGCELFEFNLVDPDNRRPVDYEARRRLLHTLVEKDLTVQKRRELLVASLAEPESGLAKLLLIRQGLRLRREDPALFAAGAYRELAPRGPRARHLLAFARAGGDRAVVAVAGRWFALLESGGRKAPEVWADTFVAVPDLPFSEYRSVLSGEDIPVVEEGGKAWFRAADLFADFPVALLESIR